MKLKNALERYLKEKGWSKYEFAKRSGLSEQRISHIFTDRQTDMLINTFINAAKTLGIKPGPWLDKLIELDESK